MKTYLDSTAHEISGQQEVRNLTCWFPRRTEPVRRIISIEN
jgi:hypothetical protein